MPSNSSASPAPIEVVDIDAADANAATLAARARLAAIGMRLQRLNTQHPTWVASEPGATFTVAGVDALRALVNQRCGPSASERPDDATAGLRRTEGAAA